MSHILAVMYKTIYDMLYNPTDMADAFGEFNGYLQLTLANDYFTGIYDVVMILGIGLLAAAFLTQLLDKVAAGDFSINVLFRHMLKYVIIYGVLINLMFIFNQLMDLTVATFNSLDSIIQAAYGTVGGTEVDINKLTYGFKEYISITQMAGYFILGLIPYAIAMLYTVVVYFFVCSRLFEVTIRVTMAPVVCGGSMLSPPGNNDLQRYIKNTAGILFQIVVVLVIWACLSFAHSALLGAEDGSGTSMGIENPADLLDDDESYVIVKINGSYKKAYGYNKDYSKITEDGIDANLADITPPKYTHDSIVAFVQSMLLPDNYFVSVGIMLSALLMLFKSRRLSMEMFS